MSAVWFIEVNILNGRKTRLRVEKITEVREDLMTEGKVRGEKKPVVRIIMEGGANVVAEGETMAQFWERLQTSLQRPLYLCPSPIRGDDDL
jgi:hypothetical protein